jgi:hopene-associated glycosyltransferase HpnB
MPVILVDDESTDGTADVARRAAEKAGKADALIVIQSKPLPAGWTGKLWSMHQGIERARALNPAWLLLADADVLHGPETVANLGLIAAHDHYDLVSFMVKLHCESLAEKLLIPAFVYFFFMLYPPAWIRDARRSTAGAAGGCMLVRTEALERAGGLESIRGAVIDDCSLARLLKQHGAKLWLGLTDQTQSLRRYNTFSDVEHMVSRTAFNQLKHSSLLLLCTIAGMVITYLAPPLLLLTGSRLTIFVGVAAWAAMTITYSTIVRY